MKYLVSSRACFCRLFPFSQVKSPKANGSLAGSGAPGTDVSGGERIGGDATERGSGGMSTSDLSVDAGERAGGADVPDRSGLARAAVSRLRSMAGEMIRPINT